MYDPSIGRFLSPDPVFQNLNAYGYALGNPVWYWDPDGELSTATKLAIGVAIGAALFPAHATAIALIGVFWLAIIEIRTDGVIFPEPSPGPESGFSGAFSDSTLGESGEFGPAFAAPAPRCSPVRVPRSSWESKWLLLLLALQLIMGIVVLGRRTRTRRER